MPDDDLFPTEDGAPAEGAPAGGEAAAPDGVTLTHEEVQGYTDQLAGLQQNNAQLQQSQAQLSQVVNELSNTLGRLGLNGENGGDNGEMDATAFLTDPETAVRKLVDGSVDERLRAQAGPLLGQLVEQAHEGAVNAERASITADFGEEAWDKIFAPILNPVFERTRATAPSQLSNKQAISNAVASVKGNHFAQLSEMRNAALQNRTTNDEAETQRMMEIVKSNLTGGVHRAAPGKTLSDDMRDHLDREQRETGTRPDEKQFLVAINSGPTLTDYLEASKKGAA